jgi:hypothetical protein
MATMVQMLAVAVVLTRPEQLQVEVLGEMVEQEKSMQFQAAQSHTQLAAAAVQIRLPELVDQASVVMAEQETQQIKQVQDR